MKISEATLGNLGDVVAGGTKNVASAVKAGDTSGSAGSALGALLDPNRIASGISTQDQMAQNNFVKDFVSKAIQAIDNGIKGNYIDPKKAMSSDPLTPNTTAQTKSQDKEPAPGPNPAPGPAPSPAPAPTPNPAPGPAPAPAPAPAQAQTTTQQPQTFTFGREKYTKGPKGWVDSKGKAADQNVSKLLDKAESQAGSTQQAPADTTPTQTQPKAGVQPNVTPAPNTKKAGPQQGKSTVPQGGGKVPGYTSQSPNAVRKRQARAAAKTAPVQPAQPAAKPPRQTVAQKAQSYLQHQALKKQAAPSVVKESSYTKLNRLFESYMAMLENEPEEQVEVVSIPDFLGKEFLPDYFHNIPYTKAKQQFMTLLKATENNPKPTKELTTMAKLAWSLAPKTKEKDKKPQASGQTAAPTDTPQQGQQRQGTDWGDLGKNL